MKVLVESYGCTLNRGEGDEFTQAAQALGHTITDNEEDAEAAVLFTCGVIETTERRMLKRIEELKGVERFLICGCLGNISPEKILSLAPNAKLVQPTDHITALSMLDGGAHSPHTEPPKQSPIGILPIASGCLGDCAYCVTRVARRDLRSRSVNDIVDRAKHLIGRGAVELQVCAQDTIIYGRDIGSDLDTLVTSLAKLDGDFMMRVGMMNPRYAVHDIDEILRTYSHAKVFRFLHLPVQSGCDAVLERMGRGYAVDDFITVIGAFRKTFPRSTISTDIIVGFPGETDGEFEDTVDLIKETRPDIVNVTRFSARPNTPAAKMGGQVVSRIAKERSRRLTDLRFEILSSKFEDRIGMIVEALATEHRKPGTTLLRTGEYWPIMVKRRLSLGRRYEISLKGYEKTHLIGEVYPKP